MKIQIKRNAVNNIKGSPKKGSVAWTLDRAVTNEVRNVGVPNIHMYRVIFDDDEADDKHDVDVDDDAVVAMKFVKCELQILRSSDTKSTSYE